MRYRVTLLLAATLPALACAPDIVDNGVHWHLETARVWIDETSPEKMRVRARVHISTGATTFAPRRTNLATVTVVHEPTHAEATAALFSMDGIALAEHEDTTVDLEDAPGTLVVLRGWHHVVCGDTLRVTAA